MTKHAYQQSVFSGSDTVAVAPFAQITVTNASDDSAASIWDDADGTTPIADGVLLADENGYFIFYADEGTYNIAILSDGISKTLENVEIGAGNPYSGVFKGSWDMSSGISGPAAPATDYYATHTDTAITPAATLGGTGPLFLGASASKVIPRQVSGTADVSFVVPSLEGRGTAILAVLAVVNSSATLADIENIINSRATVGDVWAGIINVNLYGPVPVVGHYNNGTLDGDGLGECGYGSTITGRFDFAANTFAMVINDTVFATATVDFASMPAGDDFRLVAGIVSTSADLTFGDGDLQVDFSGFSAATDATLPVGALDNDWYEVSAGGYFHGKTTRVHDYVKLIRGKTDLIVVDDPTGLVRSVNGVAPVDGDVVLAPGDVAAVSYNAQSLTAAQQIQAQRNIGTQLFFGQDFPAGAVAPAALMKFDADGMWVDFVVRQATPIWHGYVSSLMLMASTADKVTANTWADPYGYIHDGALRPDGTPQQGITCTPGDLSKFDLSSGDFTIEFFYTPSAYDNIYTENRGILSLGNDYVGSLRYFLRYIGGAGFMFYVYPSPGSPQIAVTSASILTTGVEHHIAVQRISGVYSITVNGADVTYEQHNVSPMAPVSENLFSLGQLYCGGYSEQMTGAIRQFRMTKGIAVYPTYPFTPPTSFPSSI